MTSTPNQGTPNPGVPVKNSQVAELQRLVERDGETQPWALWGSYLPERQWGTVREDYSADGNAWTSFPHDHARSRAYRWGEDGLLGVCDDQCRLCFSVALWNGVDPILKERPFGLGNPEGNHGEDIKDYYFHQANTPTHSFMRGLYKYPRLNFPTSTWSMKMDVAAGTSLNMSWLIQASLTRIATSMLLLNMPRLHPPTS
jgi:hypothetical protein